MATDAETIVKTILSPDGRERIQIARRADGAYEAVSARWYRNVWNGEVIAEGWGTPSRSGVLCENAEIAEREALASGWLGGSDDEDE